MIIAAARGFKNRRLKQAQPNRGFVDYSQKCRVLGKKGRFALEPKASLKVVEPENGGGQQRKLSPPQALFDQRTSLPHGR